MRHVPVLLTDVLAALRLGPRMNAVDCTLGDGGHAEAMLEAIGPKGKLLGIDVDPESLLRAKQYLYRFREQVTFVRDSFAHLEKIVAEQEFKAIQAVLFDLGWSSPQFEERGRGLSFQLDEPLDMRYASAAGDQAVSSDQSESTAAEILNRFTADELDRTFHQYGEENFSREIAAAIVEHRQKNPIERTGQLVAIILGVYRQKLESTADVPWIGGLHPATKVFQALRIAVNQELEALRQALPQALRVLAPGGRLAVISFHSLEDRIVKQFFVAEEARGVLRRITKKPITAAPAEVAINPRARSAKLRVVERLAGETNAVS